MVTRCLRTKVCINNTVVIPTCHPPVSKRPWPGRVGVPSETGSRAAFVGGTERRTTQRSYAAIPPAARAQREHQAEPHVTKHLVDMPRHPLSHPPVFAPSTGHRAWPNVVGEFTTHITILHSNLACACRTTAGRDGKVCSPHAHNNDATARFVRHIVQRSDNQGHTGHQPANIHRNSGDDKGKGK